MRENYSKKVLGKNPIFKLKSSKTFKFKQEGVKEGAWLAPKKPGNER